VTQIQLLMDISNILVQLVFWLCVGFVAGTSTFWPWWKTDLGWNIILKTAIIADILLPVNLHILFGINIRTLFWQWWGVVNFGAIGVVVTWRFAVLWTIQRYNPPPAKSGRAAFKSYRSFRKLAKEGKE
jgi:hypothetical protein